MSLTTRLSAFFLSALGVVLLCFSGQLYTSIHVYLFRQLDERMRSSQAILAAATETHPNGVEWEPDVREMPLGQDFGPDRIRWIIHDGSGHRIDRSRNWIAAELTRDWQPGEDNRLPATLTDGRRRTWKIAQRLLLRDLPPGGRTRRRMTGTPARRVTDRTEDFIRR